MSRKIPATELANVIRENSAQRENTDNAGFQKEFSSLPSSTGVKCDAGSKPENIQFNRFKNIFAYDHSRVVLKSSQGKTDTDYTNANYIRGYQSREKMFIASQGPMKQTINHFWQMIWQEKIAVIVMLTNCIEGGQSKCLQYWPDEGEEKFGEITVSVVDKEEHGDYTVRKMNFSKGKKQRQLTQLHYTSWPDQRCPTTGAPILNIRRRMRHLKEKSQIPVLVHCSAGVGRTGTFIALDFLLHELSEKETKEVDVKKCVSRLREDRMNMVQTLEQYIFIYQTLLEFYNCSYTLLTLAEFDKFYAGIKKPSSKSDKGKLHHQYEFLKSICPLPTEEQCKEAKLPKHQKLNRSLEVLPDDSTRLFLADLNGRTNYINAVFVPAHDRHDAFVATQMPLTETVVDFWRLIFDFDCCAIVALNDIHTTNQPMQCYWSDKGEFPPFKVESKESNASKEYKGQLITRDLIIRRTDKKPETRELRQFQITGWSEPNNLPPDDATLISLQKPLRKWREEHDYRPVLVHCMDGASRTGLFCVISLLLEQIDKHKEVDIFNAVKLVRRDRPQFIQKDQYEFCYHFVARYARSPNLQSSHNPKGSKYSDGTHSTQL